MFEMAKKKTNKKQDKGLGSQTGFFGPVFFTKSQNHLQSYKLFFFSYLNTYMCFRYAKISGQKIMMGFILASDIWVSDQKMAKIDVFWSIFG